MYYVYVYIYKHKHINIYVFLFASGQNVAHVTQLTIPLRANRWLNKLTIVENWMKESTIRVYDDDCVVDIAPPLSHFFSPPLPPSPLPITRWNYSHGYWHGMAWHKSGPNQAPNHCHESHINIRQSLGNSFILPVKCQ